MTPARVCTAAATVLSWRQHLCVYLWLPVYPCAHMTSLLGREEMCCNLGVIDIMLQQPHVSGELVQMAVYPRMSWYRWLSTPACPRTMQCCFPHSTYSCFCRFVRRLIPRRNKTSMYEPFLCGTMPHCTPWHALAHVFFERVVCTTQFFKGEPS